MKEEKLRLKLNLIYLMTYGTMACYYPFLNIYFKEKGLSYTEIGIGFALNSIISVIAQPIWGYITDKYLTKKKTIVITLVASSIVALGFVFASKYYMIVALIMLFMWFQSAVSPVSDAYCYDFMEIDKNLQYGQVRLMGSAGYAVTSLLLGIAIQKTSIDITVYTYLIISFIVILILRTIKFEGKHGGKKIDISDINYLLKNKKYIIFIVSVVFISIALGANGSYIAVLIDKTGGDVSKLGLLWFIVAMSELPVLFFGSKLLKKYGELNLYIISMIIYIIRYLLDSYCSSYTVVIGIQILQGITFTLYLVAAMQYINKISEPKMRTSAITLYAAIGGGIGGFIGNFGGGIFLEHYSIFVLFRIMAAFAFLALITAVILKRYERPQKKITL